MAKKRGPVERFIHKEDVERTVNGLSDEQLLALQVIMESTDGKKLILEAITKTQKSRVFRQQMKDSAKDLLSQGASAAVAGFKKARELFDNVKSKNGFL